MSLAGALAGGFVGTLVLTTGLRLAQVAGLTRMDIPLLLGKAFSEQIRRAQAIGYALHFFNGLLFALGYWLVFSAVDQAGWLFGAVLGVVHAAFAGGALVNVLLPRCTRAWGRSGRTRRKHHCSSRPGSCCRTTVAARHSSRCSATSPTVRSWALSRRASSPRAYDV